MSKNIYIAIVSSRSTTLNTRKISFIIADSSQIRVISSNFYLYFRDFVQGGVEYDENTDEQ